MYSNDIANIIANNHDDDNDDDNVITSDIIVIKSIKNSNNDYKERLYIDERKNCH